MAARLRLGVEMDDGTTWEVVCDQRDYASWEIQPFHDAGRPVTRVRYLAFSASCRERKTDLSWPKFNAAAVDVGALDVDDVDPTQPDHSDAD